MIDYIVKSVQTDNSSRFNNIKKILDKINQTLYNTIGNKNEKMILK